MARNVNATGMLLVAVVAVVVAILISIPITGCGKGVHVGEVEVSPSQTLKAGQSAVLSIEIRRLDTRGTIQWSAADGTFTGPTDQSSVHWVAPDSDGQVIITCKVTSRGETTAKSVAVDVVSEAAADATSSRLENGEQGTGDVLPTDEQPTQEPYDIDRGGFIPSGWMGDAASGTKYVRLERLCTERPRPGSHHCQKWTYTPGPLGWMAVAWQYPENNWGDTPGKNLSGPGFTRVTVWARCPEKHGTVVQFKAGGCTDPSKKHQASFEVQGDFTELTPEWRQYSLDIRNEDLTNVASAFVVVLRADDNPKGATLYLDDIQYE